MTAGTIAMICLCVFTTLAWAYVYLRQLRTEVLENWLDELVQDCQGIVTDPRASNGARAVALLCADMIADRHAGKRLVFFIIKKRLGMAPSAPNIHGTEVIKDIIRNAPKPVRKKLDDYMLKCIGGLFLRSSPAFWFYIVPIILLQGVKSAFKSMNPASYIGFRSDFVNFAGRRFG